MRLQQSLLLLAASIVSITSCQTQLRENTQKQEAAVFVDPFIGTDKHGHTFPGASVPFGMVQLSPQTRLSGWDGCSGYHYSDTIIYGFAHTALNGTGCSDYGDILITPASQPIFENHNYCSQFDKDSETAQPGYYSVFLKKHSTLVELTATQRVGYHKYTFQNKDKAGCIIDLTHRDKVLDSRIEVVGNNQLRGMRRSTNWAKDMVWYFHITFSKPFKKVVFAKENSEVKNTDKLQGNNIKAYLQFDNNEGEALEIKVSLSAVDEAGAFKNMQVELPDWDFQKTKQQAYDQWNSKLEKIQVSSNDQKQLTAFYSALYRIYLQPNVYQDIDGRYRGIDKNIGMASDFTNYTVFSLWDTYRTFHPLMTIIEPKITADFVNTMLNMHSLGGLLPIWELAANETYCMIGNHAISVIADAYAKGINGFDSEKALKAMINSAEQDHYGLDIYRKFGYIPGDKEHESVSKTLEYAYNDWCIATMAQQMGKNDIYQKYIKRSQFYKNILDRESKFMRPKLNGSWLTPFDPTTVDWHFTEANSWQYSFYVPHDITGFYTMLGGKEILINQLDNLFSTSLKISGRDLKDISGLIGQYAHGNEPSHHIAYLYTFANQPWKTQRYVRKIMDDFYTPTADGIIGNEDCGQMSAWLVMSAMGFYPVTPGNDQYIIGAPWLPEVKINLENGKVFKITATNVSNKNIYINSAKLNGKKYSKSYIKHSDIIKGGHLEFDMSDTPNKQWGTSDNDIPTTHVTDEIIVPVPIISYVEPRIRDSIKVDIIKAMPDCRVFYTLDGTKPDTNSTEYTTPLTLKQSTILKAVAYSNTYGYSYISEAKFTKIDIDKKINILTQWSKSYHAGGAEALIDGIRGSQNWRLGGWQGYQGTDFEAIIDLEKTKQIHAVSIGFIQDISAWIWMPEEVTFYTSDNGQNFKKNRTIKNNIPDDDYTIKTQNIEAKLNVETRYIKVKAVNKGIIPSWHLGSGGQSFIFIDEITIR